MSTSFDADSRGNVSSSTDARGNTTYFSYQWGQLSHIQTPQYTISRGINADGTIASETRRGFTTAYSYDAVGRIIRVAPSVGNAITTTYDNSAGLSFQVARAGSTATTFPDGFGRLTGTRNSVGVQTDIALDACGRATYESYPFSSSNIGTTVQYDGLSRVTRTTHPDYTSGSTHPERHTTHRSHTTRRTTAPRS